MPPKDQASDARAAPAERAPVNSLQSGLTMFVTGMTLHRFSPDLFGHKTPMIVGNDWTHSASVIGILTLILIPLLDFLSGPRGKRIVGETLHMSAVEWLNRAALFVKDGRQPDRASIFLACLASAIGEASVFYYAFITLVPPLGTFNVFFSSPVPMGHIISVPVFAWYKGGENGEMTAIFAVTGAFYAIAAIEGGVVAAAMLNFIASVAMVSLYFHAKLKDKVVSVKDGAVAGGLRKSGGGSAQGSSKKKR